MRFFQRLFYSFFFVTQSLFAMGLLQDAPCVSLYHLAPFLPDSISNHTTRVQRGNPVPALLFSGATEADFQLVIECMTKKADCRVLRCSAQFIRSVMDTFKKAKKVQCPTIIILDDLANIDAAQSATLYRYLRGLKKIDGLCTVSWAPDTTKLSENIQHHFNIPLKLALPTEQQRTELLKKLIPVYVRSHTIDTNHFAQKTAGWSISNIVTLVQNSAQNIQSDTEKSPQECFEAVYQAMQKAKDDVRNTILAAASISYAQPSAFFEELSGHMPKDLLDIKRSLKRDGYHPGILFHGPPGTGKSSLAEAIAADVNWKYVRCNGSSFASSFQDGGVLRLQKAIAAIQETGEPTVLCYEALKKNLLELASRGTDDQNTQVISSSITGDIQREITNSIADDFENDQELKTLAMLGLSFPGVRWCAKHIKKGNRLIWYQNAMRVALLELEAIKNEIPNHEAPHNTQTPASERAKLLMETKHHIYQTITKQNAITKNELLTLFEPQLSQIKTRIGVHAYNDLVNRINNYYQNI